MSERRQTSRAEEKLDITVKVESAPEVRELEGKIFHTSSIDISLGGLQLIVDVPVPVGAQLELKVIFDYSSQNYWHKGIVMWEDEWLSDNMIEKSLYKIGVQFNTLDNPQFHSWRAAISELFERQ